MRPLCRLLGISAQGYYKHDYASNEADILSASIVLYCLYVRQKERLPKAGCRELYTLCREYFREKFTIGRDRFYNVLRSNSLMLRRTRYRPRTTDSRHGYRLYRDLVNTSPKYTPADNGRLVVADITYIYTREGFAYLSLVTRRLQQIHSRILSEQESGCGGTAESHVHGSADLPYIRNQYGGHDTPL